MGQLNELLIRAAQPRDKEYLLSGGEGLYPAITDSATLGKLLLDTRYMSDNTINSALRNLGYDTREQMTGHGFRATARTLIRELLGWDRDVIERHLAHVSDSIGPPFLNSVGK